MMIMSSMAVAFERVSWRCMARRSLRYHEHVDGTTWSPVILSKASKAHEYKGRFKQYED